MPLLHSFPDHPFPARGFALWLVMVVLMALSLFMGSAAVMLHSQTRSSRLALERRMAQEGAMFAVIHAERSLQGLAPRVWTGESPAPVYTLEMVDPANAGFPPGSRYYRITATATMGSSVARLQAVVSLDPVLRRWSWIEP